MDELTAAGRLIALLERVAYEKRPCKLCGETIYFVQVQARGVQAQHVAVYSKRGVPHESDCPRRRPPQEPLFDKTPDGLEPKR